MGEGVKAGLGHLQFNLIFDARKQTDYFRHEVMPFEFGKADEFFDFNEFQFCQLI